MKKVFIILSSALIFASCNSSNDKKEAEAKTGDTTATTTAPAAEAKDPEVAKGLALIAKSDCLTCHKLSEPLPSPNSGY